MDKLKIQSNFLDTWGLSAHTNKAPIYGTAHTILHHFLPRTKCINCIMVSWMLVGPEGSGKNPSGLNGKGINWYLATFVVLVLLVFLMLFPTYFVDSCPSYSESSWCCRFYCFCCSPPSNDAVHCFSRMGVEKVYWPESRWTPQILLIVLLLSLVVLVLKMKWP